MSTAAPGIAARSYLPCAVLKVLQMPYATPFFYIIYYAQPVDVILQCRGTHSGGGPFRAPVLLRGTLYQIVSVTQH